MRRAWLRRKGILLCNIVTCVLPGAVNVKRLANPSSKPISISVTNLGSTVSLVSIAPDRAFEITSYTSRGVSASNWATSSANDMRKLESASRSPLIVRAGPGK